MSRILVWQLVLELYSFDPAFVNVPRETYQPLRYHQSVQFRLPRIALASTHGKICTCDVTRENLDLTYEGEILFHERLY